MQPIRGNEGERKGLASLPRLALVRATGTLAPMDYWQGPSRWINAALLFIVAAIAFDAVFLLLGALESNPIVWLVDRVSGLFTAPFDGMFANQPELATHALSLVAWIVIATIALAIVRSFEAGRAARRRSFAQQLQQQPADAPQPPPPAPPAAPAAPRRAPRPAARQPRAEEEPTVRRTPR
jgi:hypothetical protein